MELSAAEIERTRFDGELRKLVSPMALRYWRHCQGLTQAEAALKWGVAETTWWRWENDRSPCPRSLALRLYDGWEPRN